MHRGRVEMTFDDGESHVLGPGGVARVDAATIRKVKNVGDEPAVYLVTGGKDGYVGRDGKLPEARPAASARRVAPAERGVRGLTVLAAAVALVAVLVAALPSAGRPLPTAPRCPVFPPDNHWNLRVDRLPVRPNSDAIVRSIGAGETMHADFGSGLYERAPIGIPFRTVRRSQPSVPVSFEYASESDGRRYPLPPKVPIEEGRASDGDRHVIVVDRSRCRL